MWKARSSINRIRLEFKVSGITGIDFSVVY